MDERTRRRRALKVLAPGPAEDLEARTRFMRESVVTANVASDRLVEVVDAGLDAATGLPFIAMELLQGLDLGQLLARRGHLAPRAAVAILAEAAAALSATHAAGIVHRDVKPSNLFLSRAPDGLASVRVLDFGIAKLVESTTRALATTSAIGTPLYMSPEQIDGDGAIDHRADLYALAHAAFTLLVGESYWQPEADGRVSLYALLVRIMRGLPEPPSARARRAGVELPPSFDVWFERAAAPHAADRFDDAVEQIAALALALDVDDAEPFALASLIDDGDLAPPAAVYRGRVRRRRTLRTAAVAVLVALGALAGRATVKGAAAPPHVVRPTTVAGAAPVAPAPTSPARLDGPSAAPRHVARRRPVRHVFRSVPRPEPPKLLDPTDIR